MKLLKRGRAIDPEAKMANIVASGTSVVGTIQARGSVRVEGMLEGELSAEGDVIIGKNADVRGNVKARSVLVVGIVHGDVRAEGRLEILPSGRVWGDVQVGSLQIAEGGLLRGACEMLVEEDDAGGRRSQQARRAASEASDESAVTAAQDTEV